MSRGKFLYACLFLLVLLAVAGCGRQTQPPAPANGGGNEPPGISALEMTNRITAEWRETGKQFALSSAAGRSGATCASCHDGYAFSVKDKINFATEWNPGGANKDMAPYPEHLVGIDCQACHAGVGLEYMNSGRVELPYGTVDNAGKGAACMFCHSGRRDVAAAFEEYRAGNATRFTYPHYGPAAIMTGLGGMEYPDMEYTSSPVHANITDSCVFCHMPRTNDGYVSHKFVMDPTYIDQTCGGCHSGIQNYNLNGFMDEVKSMLNKLEQAIKDATGAEKIYSAAGQLVFETADGNRLTTADVSTEAFVAGYNWYAVKTDGSYGIHNPRYTVSLLKNSYKALTGQDM